MAAILTPYLTFPDNARGAMSFYQDALGGELNISTFGDMGNEDPAEKDLVMHAALTTPSGLTLFASDSLPSMGGTPEPFGGFSVSLSGDSTEDLRGYWEKLSDGAIIRMPLEKAQWGDEFGMLTDKFGVAWMVNITQPQ